MAEEEHFETKNEEPTARKREKAKEKGNVAQSKEVYHVLLFSSLLLFLWWGGSRTFWSLFKRLHIWEEKISLLPSGGGALLQQLSCLARDVFFAIFPFFLTLAAFILGGLWLQTKWRLKHPLMQIKLEHASPLSGMKRLFSLKNLIEFFKNTLKLAVVLGLTILMAVHYFPALPPLSGSALSAIWCELKRLMYIVLAYATVGVGVIAVLDYGYQWFALFKKLFMSRFEIKEEYKELEKDPHVKRKQRQMQREVALMRRAAERMPEATVLIMNPTHYAVALQWVEHKMTAPEVIAKGADRVALYMKDLAQKNFIPVVEQPPLAKMLYKTLQVGQEILPEHYKAVAEVIRYITRTAKRRAPTSP
jgi:flagellar biosynthetic protein FlhB